MGQKIDLTGQRFGRLVVVCESPKKPPSKAIRWLCRCDCGNLKTVAAFSLNNGSTRSCGCLRKEVAINNIPCILVGDEHPNYKHGQANSRIYRTWADMKKRCYNPHVKDYGDYGGRGIAICDEWRNDFIAFYTWAMDNGYRDDLTIDRKDPDGDYCPENCRFATRLEQSRNQRRNQNK